MDQLKTMEIFVAVVKCGSFSQAAKQMGLSRPIVTNYIQALEKRLGVRLINRTTRHLFVTEIGQGYFALCSNVLRQIELGEETLTKLQMKPQGRLRILAPKSFGGLHMGMAIAHFAKAHPEIDISMVLDDPSNRSLSDFIDGQFDIGVRLAALRDSSIVPKRLDP